MNTKPEVKENTRQRQCSKSKNDVVARGITKVLVGLLAFSCRVVQTTPTSIARHDPNVRPNSPPASGGISSLGN